MPRGGGNGRVSERGNGCREEKDDQRLASQFRLPYLALKSFLPQLHLQLKASYEVMKSKYRNLNEDADLYIIDYVLR